MKRITQGLEITEDEGATHLKMVKPTRGSDDNVEMAVPSLMGT